MYDLPVAGKVLEGGFLGGLSLTDLDVFIPAAFVATLFSYTPLPFPVFVFLGFLSSAGAIFVLWRAPRSQRPSKWALAKARFQLSENKYRNRPEERDYPDIHVQNEILTLRDSTEDDNESD